MNHEGQDTHLGGATVVELDGELSVDGLLVPAGSLELSGLDVVLAGGVAELDEADEGDDLGSAGGRDGVEGGEAGLHGGEGKAVGDVTREADAGGGDEVAEDGKHGNAAVLGLDGAQAVKASLVSILQESKRIPEAKRGLSSNGVLEVHLEGSRGLGHAGRGEGGSAEEGSEDSDELEHGSNSDNCDGAEEVAKSTAEG